MQPASTLLRLSIFGCLALLTAPSASFAQPAAQPATPTVAEQAVDFQKQVAPVLRKYCVGCHDPDAAEGGLMLHTFVELMKGGERGAAVAPGDSKRSRLVRVLTGEAEPKMPPEGSKAPSADEIALLARWIDFGAVGPKGETVDKHRLTTPVVAVQRPAKPGVHALAVSPDGKLLAVGNYRKAQLAAFDTGVVSRQFLELPGEVTSLRFSKSGDLLIAAAGEPGLFGEAFVWKVADGSLVRSIRGHDDSLYAAELSPDQTTLATAGYDRLVKLWRLADGALLHTLKGHNDAVYAVSFSPDGRKLLTASGDRTAKLWDVPTGERLETFGQPLKELYTASFSPDGRHVLAAGVDNRLRVWRISETGQEGTNPIQHSIFAHEGALLRMAFSRDGKRLATSADDRTVKIWDGVTFAERLLLEPQSDWANALAFSADGRSLVVGRHDGVLALYDPETGKKQRDLPLKPPAPKLAKIEPKVLPPGKTTRVVLTGEHLADLLRFSLNVPGFTSVKHAAAAGRAEFDVTIPADFPLGAYSVSAAHASESSNALPLYVDDLPMVAEVEPNDLPSQAQAISLPASVWGVLSKQGDADHYQVPGRKGRTLVFDAGAQQLSSKANLVLTVFDDHGRALAVNNDFDGQSDSLLAFTPPTDGVYLVQVRDLMLAGSAEHFYRLSCGEFSFVTGVFPFSAGPNQKLRVALAGYNLPPQASVELTTPASGSIAVPLNRAQFRHRGKPTVTVGEWPEVVESEPNDAPPQAQRLSLPVTVSGRLWSPRVEIEAGRETTLSDDDSSAQTDADLYRFTAQAGERWILETDAARRGSPVDTRIEVLHADGRPVQRLLLQAVRDSYITFRPINSITNDARVKNWEEMALNEYLYMQGEICRIFRMPEGPDSGFRFYSGGGSRLCYFDTSAVAHAMDEPCYIVEPHPPGAQLVPNGLPVFPLHFENDDAGDRTLGADSRLTFTAPAAGDYLVRVVDSQARGGDRFAYRLTIRRPKPDYKLTLATPNITVGPGGAQLVTFKLQRFDDFTGPVDVRVDGLPSGFRMPEITTIEAGHFEASAALSADLNAKPLDPKTKLAVRFTASALIDDLPVEHPAGALSSLKLGPPPKLIVHLEPAEITIAPGQTVAARLRVDRNGFDERVSMTVANLPHGVIVDNIGLSGVLVREGETERPIFLRCAPWVQPLRRPISASTPQAGSHSSTPVTLIVAPR